MANARIKAQEWWLKQLRELTGKVMAQEDKRRAKVMQKNQDALADYKSEAEIREAYGYGFITERKCEKLLNLWEESYAGESEEYRHKIAILSDLYTEAKNVMQDLQGVNNGRP